MDLIPAQTNVVASRIVDAAFAVHSELGPGLLESVYETCLAYELRRRELTWMRQVAVPITCGNVRLESGLRLDLVVDNCVVVELKAVEALNAVHTAQMLTYLKLSGLRLGLLINFNVPLIKDGINDSHGKASDLMSWCLGGETRLAVAAISTVARRRSVS